MGVYLSKANTTKESEDGGDPRKDYTRFGVSAMQGWRQAMEDAHIAVPLFSPLTESLNRDISLYGVFDGHGGRTVSEWISRHFYDTLMSSVDEVKKAIEVNSDSNKDSGYPTEIEVLCEALQRTFLQLDKDMQSAENREEIREIFMTTHMKSKEEEQEQSSLTPNQQEKGLLAMHNNPRTLLQALLCGAGKRAPTIRMVEQDGEQYFQIHPSVDDDDIFDSNDDGEKQAEKSETTASKDSSLGGTGGQDSAPASQNGGNQTSVPEEREDDSKKAADSPTSPRASLIAEEMPAAVSAIPPLEIIEDNSDEADEDSSNTMNRNSLPAWAPETSGAAAIVAAVVGGPKPFLITANAGDSRCVLCRNGEAVEMSVDHKPNLPDELDRITKAGGAVLAGRVDGNLNLSRTIGDLFYKNNTKLGPEAQKITAFPDVRVIPLTRDDEFVILACDGIWDCVTNEEAVRFVKERLGDNPDDVALSKICEELCDFCLADNPMHSDGGIGCDNMTCIIVLLNRQLREVGQQEAGSCTLYKSSINRI